MVKHEPPSSRETEEYLLSCCLQNEQAIDVACDYIDKEDFYIPSNGSIFDTIVTMRLGGEAVDTATLAAKGVKQDFLHYLTDLPVLFGHTKDYAQSISQLALRRRIIKAGHQMVETATENNDAEAVLDASEALLYQARGRGASEGPSPLRELLRAAEGRIDDAHAGKAHYSLQTHLEKLNEVIVGLAPGTFNILAARPAQGKTALGLEIAKHAAQEHRVAMFSVEMTKDELVDRLLASTSNVPLTNLRAGKVTDPEQIYLHNAVAELARLHLTIDDSSSSMFEVHRKVRRMAARGPLGLVVIDYIQLLSMGKGRMKEENRQQEVAGISRQMKLMAREFGVPVLALSQLSRPERKFDGANSKPPKPTLASLRESGALEQDADQVWFLYRADEESPEVELMVAKNRSGPTGKVLLHFIPHLTKFIEV